MFQQNQTTVKTQSPHFPHLLVCLPVLSLERKGFQQHETKLKILLAQKSIHRTKVHLVKYISYSLKAPPRKPQGPEVKGKVARKSSKRQQLTHFCFHYSKTFY